MASQSAAKKVRIYSPFLPYPVSEGAYQVIFEQVLGFAKYHQVELIIWKETLEQAQRKAGGNLESVFGSRVQVRSFAKQAQVESKLGRLARLEKSFLVKDASPGLFYYPPHLDLRSELGPCDLAIYHYTYAWSWLRQQTKTQEKLKVLYFHNIESDLFDYRAECEPKWFLKWIHRLNAHKLRIHEQELVQLVDQFWHISPKDMSDTIFKGIGLSLEQSVRVPIYRPEYFETRSRNFLKQYSEKNPVVLGFIGGLDFDANRDSLEWILDQVCPGLKAKGFKGRIEVAGKHAPARLLKKMKAFEFVHYEGFRKSLDNFWNQMSVMLVPHISGSGVRIKLLDSLGSGIPALANDQVIERIHPLVFDQAVERHA